MNLINIITAITLSIFLFNRNKDKKIDNLLLIILVISFLNEVLSYFLVIEHKNIAINSSVYAGCLLFCWLQIMMIHFNNKFKPVVLFVFAFFAGINLLFFDGLYRFNSYTFLFGSSLYIVIFCFNFYNLLRREVLNSIRNNDFILILSPLLFLIGFSLIFSFKTKSIDTIKIFNFLSLYSFISYFANMVYYTLINIYIFRERKLKNA